MGRDTLPDQQHSAQNKHATDSAEPSPPFTNDLHALAVLNGVLTRLFSDPNSSVHHL